MRYSFLSRLNSCSLLLIAGLICISATIQAQNNTNKNKGAQSVAPPVIAPDTSKNNLLAPVVVQDIGKSAQYLTLQQCIEYALQHQPNINRALLNVDIVHTTNKINLAGTLPQVSASGSLVHNIESGNGGVVIGGGGATGAGSATGSGGTTTVSKSSLTFIPGISVSQAIFNPSLLHTYKSAPLLVKQAQQATDSARIFIVSSVTKSFYTLLLTLEQINVLKEDTAQFGKSLRDAYYQYKGGIVDETDYEQAQITLNNTMAQLKQANENVIPQYATLKQAMGFLPEQQFNVLFDTLQMTKSIHIDTTQQLEYEKRIEFQQINTAKSLQDQTISFYRYSYLPTISAFYNYELDYQNKSLGSLFNSSFPTSLIGVSFNLPIFTGFSRLNNLKKARLQKQVLDDTEAGLKSQIYTEYTTALANYKGNYYNLQLLQRNVALSRRVYFVVALQYKQGIVPYLNVITAESNLITSEINYLNSLFQVLSNKVDLEKAMGAITY